MTKQELMETYTAEQLAEMVINLDDSNKISASIICNLETEIKEIKEKYAENLWEHCDSVKKEDYEKEINRLQSEVEKYRKAFEDAKNERDCQIAEHRNEIDELKQRLERQETATKYAEEYVNSLKCSVDRKQDAINQIDGIICELFGIAHNGDIYSDDFKKLLREKSEVGKTIADFLPTEPIKVADMLINAEGEYEHSPIVKKICGTDKGTYSIFDIGELRQIAEHLLVYCNHNGEVEE